MVIGKKLGMVLGEVEKQSICIEAGVPCCNETKGEWLWAIQLGFEKPERYEQTSYRTFQK